MASWPLIEEEISEEQALERTVAPFHAFMLKHVREKDLELFMDLAAIGPVQSAIETPLRALIPAFMISELRRAFEIGLSSVCSVPDDSTWSWPSILMSDGHDDAATGHDILAV